MIKIYQIYYDEFTLRSVADGCIPLDNTNPSEAGWYEFTPILNCLNSQNLNPKDYFGFISPKFEIKTGIHPRTLIEFVKKNQNNYKVFISNRCWDQAAFFLNVWYQGDFWHPGLMQSTQDFINTINLKLNLSEVIGNKYNSVMSNFVVATGEYWMKWAELANKFVYFLNNHPLGIELNTQHISYGSDSNPQRLAVFIQERFAPLLLSLYKYETCIFDDHMNKNIFPRLFLNTPQNKKLLLLCDEVKQHYLVSKNIAFLNIWRELRNCIELNVK